LSKRHKLTCSFSFSLALPGSLATHDCHTFGIIAYHAVALVRGCSDQSGRWFGSIRTSGNSRAGWLEGDLFVQRNMLVHAITDPGGGVHQLNMHRGGEIAGLGTWQMTAVSDVVSQARCHIVPSTG
jgi:hypothetical protein